MNVKEINAFILALENVLSEKIKLSVTKGKILPWKPVKLLDYQLMIRINVVSSGIDRIVYYLPEETANNLAREMFFGLDVKDETLIHSAIIELFYRITSTATIYKNDFIINDPPDIIDVDLMKDEKSLYGLSIDFNSPNGNFVMCVLNKK